MALANLSINVTCNTGDVAANLGKISIVTADEMRKSAASINGFQSSVDAAAKSVNTSTSSIGDSMSAVTDSIISGTEAAAHAVEQNMAHLGKEVADGISQGLDTSESKVKQFGGEVVDHFKGVAEKTIVTTAAFITFGAEAAAAVALVFNAVAALAIAYKTLDFAIGLVNGESYKSENIDALIAENKAVVELQKDLRLTAVEAGAMGDALKRLGVNKGDISAVTSGASSATSDNSDELDRLGMKYKDAAGNILQTREVVENAKKTLDEYTDGWDRNQAAVALGIGSYEQITNYLKVNQEELRKSKDRIDDYNLGIGPETQAAIGGYQAAMREFGNEQDLMSLSFKRAIADNIMPALTDLAIFFKDGWPIVARVFRYTMAEITSLFWGMKMSVDIVVDVIKGGFLSVGEIVIAAGKAAAMALTGDFAGAADVLAKGWQDAKARIGKTGEEIVADAKHNAAAMRLAWAMDDRKDINAGKGKKGKSWVPGPEEPDDELSDAWRQSNAKYLEFVKASWDRYNAIAKAGTQLELETLKISHEWGMIDTQVYFEKKHALQLKEIDSEISSAAKILKARKDAVKDLPDSDDPKQQAARNEARKHLEEAEKTYGVLLINRKKLIAGNADESKRATYEESVQYQGLAIQILELAGMYEKAAKARRDLEQSDPKFKALPQKIQDASNALSDSDISQAQLRDVREKARITNMTALLPNALGYVDPHTQLQASYEAERSVVEERLKFLANSNLVEIEAYKNKVAELRAIDEKYHSAKEQMDNASFQASANSLQSSMGQIGSMLMQGSKKQFEVGKEIAKAMIAIDTAKAASAAFAGAAAAGGPWGVAMGVAAGIAAMGVGTMNMARLDAVQYQARELGGPVRGGQTYLVGEKGPELFTAGASGQITSNANLQRLGSGGVNVTHVWQISTGVSETVRAEVAGLMPLITQQSIAATQQAIEDGGGMARSVRRR